MLFLPSTLSCVEVGLGLSWLNDSMLDPEGKLWLISATSALVAMLLIFLTPVSLSIWMKSHAMGRLSYVKVFLAGCIPNALFQVFPSTSLVPGLLHLPIGYAQLALPMIMLTNGAVYIAINAAAGMLTYNWACRNIAMAAISGGLLACALIPAISPWIR